MGSDELMGWGFVRRQVGLQPRLLYDGLLGAVRSEWWGGAAGGGHVNTGWRVGHKGVRRGQDSKGNHRGAMLA